MDVKTICADVRGAIKSQWGSLENCVQSAQIIDAYKQSQGLREKIKQIKDDKNLIAKQFKEHKDDPNRLAALKTEMQKISTQLTEAQNQLKLCEAELLAYFETGFDQEPQTDALPYRFTCPTPTEDKNAITSISVIPLEKGRFSEWDTYVEGHPKSTPYHMIAWKNIIENSFQHENIYFVATNPSGEIVGVLPITRLKSKLFGDFGVSIPFVNYGGPLADSVKIAQLLVSHANTATELQACSHIEYRLCEPLLSLPVNNKKVSMILRLPQSVEQLDQQLGAKVRAQFNQATKHPVTVKFGGLELLNDFYRVFATNMRDLGTPVYAKSFFKNIIQEDSKKSWICVVYVGNRPAGTAFLCGHKDMMEIPWASTIKKFNSMNINMWMYRQILGFAINNMFNYFDFGRSTKDAGTYKFKKQWGAQPVEHHWYYQLTNSAGVPQINPDNPKYKLAIAIWQKIPVWVTKFIGPPIVKSLG